MKTALITGASGGIGCAVAKKFLEKGYFVIAQYNTDQKGIEFLQSEARLLDKGDYLFCVQADFTNEKSVCEMMEKVNKSFPRLDVVVNNAGAGLYKLITETTVEEWDKLFAINIKSAYIINNYALKGMISSQKGSIINLSSMWGQVGASMEVAYSASKSAMIGYTKALAKEVAPSGITVNCVCPGVIDTKMNARFTKEDIDELIEQTPLGRIGKATDIASLVYFLASEDAQFIKGQVITCDGGFSL